MSDAKIGLEIHVYVRTRSKMFCACDADFLAAAEPNRNVCATCTGQPGAKPMAPNAAAIEAGVRVARALGCRVTPHVRFLRKHYFYPDLPSNYQRTSEPFATGGALAGVALTEIHWEEDPGAYDLKEGLVDYNRSGAPLLEIVTEPGFTSAAHARRALDELRLVLAYLGVGRGEAGMKADCNVSVAGGERAEVKNVNSTRNVEAAIAYEIERQRQSRSEGLVLQRETRHFDEAAGRTVRLRVKESAADYRFLPDPDLPPGRVPADALARADAEEPPLARRSRLAAAVGVPEDQVSPIFEERALVDALAAAITEGVPPRAAFDFLLRDVRGELEYRRIAFAESRVTTQEVVALMGARAAGRVTPHVATELLRRGLDAGGLGGALAAEVAGSPAAGLDLPGLAREVVAENAKAVADYRAGKHQSVNFLVGQLMRKARGRAGADAARAAVEDALK